MSLPIMPSDSIPSHTPTDTELEEAKKIQLFNIHPHARGLHKQVGKTVRTLVVLPDALNLNTCLHLMRVHSLVSTALRPS
jgi:hypothetical protein